MGEISLRPSALEFRALRLFVSDDETRPGLSTLWAYLSDGGTTYVATDGHTVCLRRAGTHRGMPMRDIHALGAWAVGDDGEGVASRAPVPGWDRVIGPLAGGKIAPKYGMNPHYFARLGDVEKAAGRRAAGDYVPRPGMSKKNAALERSDRSRVFVSLVIPSGAHAGWYWKLSTEAALWEGMLMPRAV